MTYQVADGYDNEAGLTDVDPQPASEGIQIPEEVTAISGLVYDDGMEFAIWQYSAALTAAEYTSLLTQLGLASAKTNEVTIATTTNQSRSFVNRNAIAVRPNPIYKDGFYRDVQIRMLHLEVPS